jgi:hypothetical protein
MTENNSWARCTICGRAISHGKAYYLCSVSTCNRKRTTYRFCSPDCWDAHVADKNHRNAECIEESAPDR